MTKATITPRQAVQQLERSERGQMTCKLLRDFLCSPQVKGLDGPNSDAVVLLTAKYMIGGGVAACEVLEELDLVVERHPWVSEPA